jgi:hypothetical protein
MNKKLINTRRAVISFALLMCNAGPVLAATITLSGATGNSCSYSNFTPDLNGNLTATCVPSPSSTPTLTPTCTLSASPSVINAGQTSTLIANCSPAATSHVWTGAGTTGFTSGGTVTPSVTTAYTVIGTNADGTGNTASATVSIAVIGPSPSPNPNPQVPTSTSPIAEIVKWNKAFASINYFPFDSRAEQVYLMSYNKQMQAAKPVQYHLPTSW